jgi:hypothetical protein
MSLNIKSLKDELKPLLMKAYTPLLKMGEIFQMAAFVIVFILLYYILALIIPGIEFFLLPVIILLVGAAIVGLIIVPLTYYMVYNDLEPQKWLIWLSSLAIGAYLGFIITTPISYWEKEQRISSGIIISEFLEQHRSLTGNYPKSLSELNKINIDNKLPILYDLDEFRYKYLNGEYYLTIPSTFGYMQWDKKNTKWKNL